MNSNDPNYCIIGCKTFTEIVLQDGLLKVFSPARFSVSEKQTPMAARSRSPNGKTGKKILITGSHLGEGYDRHFALQKHMIKLIKHIQL